ncbi:MAG: 4Fe-4S dicluster domain-containing protein [Thermodesulfobacteriota bacterium]
MDPGPAEKKRLLRTGTRKIARVTEGCTGCGGSPICRIFCSRDALRLMEDPENYPFKKMQVDSSRCSGCGNCQTGGPDSSHVTGCPWNAIRLVAAAEP